MLGHEMGVEWELFYPSKGPGTPGLLPIWLPRGKTLDGLGAAAGETLHQEDLMCGEECLRSEARSQGRTGPRQSVAPGDR